MCTARYAYRDFVACPLCGGSEARRTRGHGHFRGARGARGGGRERERLIEGHGVADGRVQGWRHRCTHRERERLRHRAGGVVCSEDERVAPDDGNAHSKSGSGRPRPVPPVQISPSAGDPAGALDVADTGRRLDVRITRRGQAVGNRPLVLENGEKGDGVRPPTNGMMATTTSGSTSVNPALSTGMTLWNASRQRRPSDHVAAPPGSRIVPCGLPPHVACTWW